MSSNHRSTRHWRKTKGNEYTPRLLDCLQLESLEQRNMLAGIPEPVANLSVPIPLAEVGSVVYFTASDATTGLELWKIDRPDADAVRVKDIRSGSSSSVPTDLTNVAGLLYFTANDDIGGRELWKSDGTETGTMRVKDIQEGNLSSDIRYLTNVDGTLYFSLRDELWKSDGSEQGTVRVKHLPRNGAVTSHPHSLTNGNGTLYFVSGNELWKSNGTETETVRLKNTLEVDLHFNHAAMTNMDGTLFFSARAESNGFELWKTDGSEVGTVLVKDIRVGPGSSRPSYFTNVSGTIYFVATDGVSGYELWKSDGSEVGTSQVKDIWPGSNPTVPIGLSQLCNVDGMLYVNGSDGLSGIELWKTDGTKPGTVRIKDIGEGQGSSYPYSLTNVNGSLYFTAFDTTSGFELWKTDGTAEGTSQVMDLWPGSDPTLDADIWGPGNLTNVGGVLYFYANNGTDGYQLWRVRAEANVLGDLNADGSVDAADAGLMFANWGGAGTGDLTNDGIVDAADAGVMFANWTGDSGPKLRLTSPLALPIPKVDQVRLRLSKRDVDKYVNCEDDMPGSFEELPRQSHSHHNRLETESLETRKMPAIRLGHRTSFFKGHTN